MTRAMCVRLILVATIGGGLAAVTGGVLLFASYGKAQKAARLSTLLNVSQCLENYARATGRYPESVWDAVPRESFAAAFEHAPIEYAARGRPYPLQGEKLVFSDKTAHRYGLAVGWFEFRQHDAPPHYWVFHEGKRSAPPGK